MYSHYRSTCIWYCRYIGQFTHPYTEDIIRRTCKLFLHKSSCIPQVCLSEWFGLLIFRVPCGTVQSRSSSWLFQWLSAWLWWLYLSSVLHSMHLRTTYTCEQRMWLWCCACAVCICVYFLHVCVLFACVCANECSLSLGNIQMFRRYTVPATLNCSTIHYYYFWALWCLSLFVNAALDQESLLSPWVRLRCVLLPEVYKRLLTAPLHYGVQSRECLWCDPSTMGAFPLSTCGWSMGEAM